jgi:hypothetical protein
MRVDADTLKTLIDRELAHVSDARVLTQIRELLVEPEMVMRDWDYGHPGQQYPCWIVFEHEPSNTGIAYCESGFGPRCPWGLISARDKGRGDLSMGMDSGWFPKFLEAYFESFAVTELPIWRVFRTDPSGVREPLSEEGEWEATWQHVYARRQADLACRYDCAHSVTW